jgi:hypothetical protein
LATPAVIAALEPAAITVAPKAATNQLVGVVGIGQAAQPHRGALHFPQLCYILFSQLRATSRVRLCGPNRPALALQAKIPNSASQ